MAGALAVAAVLPGSAQTRSDTLVVRAGLLFDGAAVRENMDVEIRDGAIVAVRPAAAGNADIDLGGRMLSPGLIDTHVHLTWYITSRGKLARSGDGEDQRTAILNATGNAWRMLQAGFTTVQSVGAAEDRFVRDAINAGVIPGPRVLSSLGQIALRDVSGGDAIAAAEAAETAENAVQALHEAGADLIKIFAVDGPSGASPANAAQLDAACAAATTAGLRSMVHANSPEAIQAAVAAGCTHVAHGAYADRAAIDAMAAAGTVFEPQCSLVVLNYLANAERFSTDETDETARQQNLQNLLAGFREVAALWMRADGLKVVYGSDAVAGAHGLNAADLVCRVLQLGQPALDALRSATSVSAEAIGFGDSIGRIAPGYAADLVAFDGDPREDAGAFMRTSFVMKGGTVYRQPPDRAGPDRVFPRQ